TVWVTGPVEEEGAWIGPPSIESRAAVEDALNTADIAVERVRIVTRTPDSLDAKTDTGLFDETVRAHADAGRTLRVNMRTRPCNNASSRPHEIVASRQPPVRAGNGLQ